jgi:hypothetical protein
MGKAYDMLILFREYLHLYIIDDVLMSKDIGKFSTRRGDARCLDTITFTLRDREST